MQLQLPDNALLLGVQTKHAYFDRKSLEESTGIIKCKYKLCGNILPALEFFTFFILTTNRDACQKYLTLTIQQADWENRDNNHLRDQCSYLDIKNVEALNKDNLLSKIKDTSNRFAVVAKLCDNKFKKLQQLQDRIHSSRHPVPPKKIELIEKALTDAKEPEKVIKKLGLN
ncbi:MAG: hypothetical protein V1701_08270 [Planctomycetota bacterium]